MEKYVQEKGELISLYSFSPSNFVLVQLAMADIILFDKNVEEVNGAVIGSWALVFYFGL